MGRHRPADRGLPARFRPSRHSHHLGTAIVVRLNLVRATDLHLAPIGRSVARARWIQPGTRRDNKYSQALPTRRGHRSHQTRLVPKRHHEARPSSAEHPGSNDSGSGCRFADRDGRVCTRRHAAASPYDARSNKWELQTQGGKGVPGSATLRDLLRARPDGYTPTGSYFEVDIDRILRSLPLPTYQRQLVVRTREGERRPDFAFPDFKFAIEGKSWKHHSGRKPWQEDNRRDEAMRAEGWDILYATWDDVHERKEQFIADVYRRLRLRGWEDARLFSD